MTIETYAELRTSVADFLNRDDLTATIPAFINLAEADMARRVRHWRMEERAALPVDEQYIDLPADWLESIDLSVTSGGRLDLISRAEMDERKESNAASGTPRYYRLTAGQIEFYPVPTDTVDMTLEYYAKFDALSDSTASNWILANHPDAYLYGALQHAAPYLGEDQRIAIWGALYQSAIDAINLESTRAKFSGPLRMGVPR